jgi:hypothetical protein
MSIEEEIVKGILSVIENISNAQLQQKTWVEGGGHPYAFFEETMHQVFDDYELAEILKDPRWHVIQKTAKEVLKAFNFHKE